MSCLAWTQIDLGGADLLGCSSPMCSVTMGIRAVNSFCCVYTDNVDQSVFLNTLVGVSVPYRHGSGVCPMQVNVQGRLL